MKKITVTLSDKAEKYFNEVMYSLPKNADGTGICSQSQAINESLETLSDFERTQDDQLANWLHTNNEWTGLKDKTGKCVNVGDMYFEETEIDEGDIRIYYVVKWIPERAMYTMLAIGELEEYENCGADALDESSRNTYVMDEKIFDHYHYKGNVIANPELLKLDNTQPEQDEPINNKQ